MFSQKTMLTNPLFYLQNSKQKLQPLLFNLNTNNNSMLDEVFTKKEANIEAALLTEAEAGNAHTKMPVRMTIMA